MPTLFYKLGFRFYFVSYDCSEPPHIHVGDDSNKICKYWLKNKKGFLVNSSGFKKNELIKIGKIVNDNYDFLTEQFNEYCKNFKK